MPERNVPIPMQRLSLSDAEDGEEPMDIDSDISESNIFTLNPLPDAAKGPIFTFVINGFEESARQMAERKDEQSQEERMAYIIGPIVEDEQIKRMRELQRRLNREEVIFRNTLLKMRTTNNVERIIQMASVQQQYSFPQQQIEQQNHYHQEEHWNVVNNFHINMKAIVNYWEQFLMSQQRPRDPIRWCALQPIDGIPVPFSQKTLVENWREKLLTEEEAAAALASSSSKLSLTSAAEAKVEFGNDVLVEGELIKENDEEEYCRVKTPPQLPKRKKRRRIANSMAKKNLTANLLIVLDD